MPLDTREHRASVQRVSASHGLDWIVAGWSYVARMPRLAVALSALLLAPILLLTTLVSLRVGNVLFSILMVYFLAVVAACCRMLDQREALPRLRDQYPVLRSQPLAVVAVIAGGATLALDFLGNNMALYAYAASWSGLGLYFLFVKLLSLLLWMALWLAPALIMLDGAGPLQAMKLSLLSTVNNILPWLLLGLLAFVLCIVAVIPVGLGLLAALPTLACASYLASRDLFA